VGTGKGDANLGAKVFFIWGSLCLLCVSFVFFLVPEMKGLSLEQVDKMMEESTPMKSGRWKPTTTFAADAGLTEKGMSISVSAEERHQRLGSVSHTHEDKE
jgi:MFS transporter, SP family, sugar:H+ symporter